MKVRGKRMWKNASVEKCHKCGMEHDIAEGILRPWILKHYHKESLGVEKRYEEEIFFFFWICWEFQIAEAMTSWLMTQRWRPIGFDVDVASPNARIICHYHLAFKSLGVCLPKLNTARNCHRVITPRASNDFSPLIFSYLPNFYLSLLQTWSSYPREFHFNERICKPIPLTLLLIDDAVTCHVFAHE